MHKTGLPSEPFEYGLRRRHLPCLSTGTSYEVDRLTLPSQFSGLSLELSTCLAHKPITEAQQKRPSGGVLPNPDCLPSLL